MTPPAGDDAHPFLSSTLSSLNPLNQNIINPNDEWLSLDSNNGFIRLYDPNDASSSYSRSKLVQCRMSTTVEQICSRLNNDLNPHTWYVQFNGDRVRHLEPDDRPLFIQHDYLLSIGFSSIQRLQQEGDKHDLGYLIRFLSGKLKICSSFSFENSLFRSIDDRSKDSTTKFIDISLDSQRQINKKMGQTKMCPLEQSTDRLSWSIEQSETMIKIDSISFSDANTNPCVIELQRANVEEVRLKDKQFCLKLSVDEGHDGALFIAFNNDEEYSRWLKRLRKVKNLFFCYFEFLYLKSFLKRMIN